MTTYCIVPNTVMQFLDANGDPLVGGSVGYYDVNSPGTPLPIFADAGGTVPLSNPVTLDGRGSPETGGSEVQIYGSGVYLMVVKDLNGVLQGQWIAFAQCDLSSALAAEIARAEAAEAALLADINAERTRAEAAEGTLLADLNAEIARAEAEEAHLQSEIDAINAQLGAGGVGIMKAGTLTTDINGNFTLTFATPFPNRCIQLLVRQYYPGSLNPSGPWGPWVSGCTGTAEALTDFVVSYGIDVFGSGTFLPGGGSLTGYLSASGARGNVVFLVTSDPGSVTTTFTSQVSTEFFWFAIGY